MSRAKQLQYPELYNNGEGDFTLHSFTYWLIRGIVDSLIIFFICVYAVFGEGNVSSSDSFGYCYGLYSAGIACYTSLVLLVNLKLVLQVNWWTWPLAAAFVFSIALWFAFAALLSALFQQEDASMYGVTAQVMSLPAFWFAVLLTVVVTTLPEFILDTANAYIFRPSDTRIVRAI